MSGIEEDLEKFYNLYITADKIILIYIYFIVVFLFCFVFKTLADLLRD